MTSDPTYSPSPELVDWVADNSAWLVTHGEVHAITTAAVAYRTPTGDPELVPWEQVRELVDAVRDMECDCLPFAHLPEYADGRCPRCAALAPFTQEPQP